MNRGYIPHESGGASKAPVVRACWKFFGRIDGSSDRGASLPMSLRSMVHLRRWAICCLLVLAVQWLPCHADSPGSKSPVAATVRFGMQQATGNGATEFRESATVPSNVGFGVQVIPSNDAPYRLVIVITAPDHLGKVEGGLVADDSSEATVVTTQALVYKGTVTRLFNLDPKDPRGVYRLDVYVDGAKVGSGEINLVDLVSL